MINNRIFLSSWKKDFSVDLPDTGTGKDNKEKEHGAYKMEGLSLLVCSMDDWRGTKSTTEASRTGGQSTIEFAHCQCIQLYSNCHYRIATALR